MRTCLGLIFTFIALLLSTSISFAQFDAYETAVLEIIGSGEVTAEPDVAYLSFSVITTALTASESSKLNAGISKTVIDKLKSIIGKGDKVQTAGYRLTPLYEFDQNTRKQEFKGYQTTNTVNLTTKYLDKLGIFIDAAIEAGANNVGGLHFDTDKRDEYQRSALTLAIRDAKASAAFTAKESGVKIVRILKISPLYDSITPVFQQRVHLEGVRAVRTPIEPGELKIRASVRMAFEIE